VGGTACQKAGGSREELTRQNSWAQSPCFCSLRPQISGSASARRHSVHAGGERANASGNEQLCGAGGRVPEGLPLRAALWLPSRLLGRAGGLAEGVGVAGTGVPGGAHCPAWAPLAEERRGPAPGRSCLPLPPLSALAERPGNPSARLWEGHFALTRLHRVEGLLVHGGHGPRQQGAPGAVTSKFSSADSEGEAGRG